MVVPAFIIIGIILLGLGIWLLATDRESGGAVGTVFGVVFLMIGLIWGCSSYFGNLSRLAEMEASYNANVQTYEATFEKSTAIISMDQIIQGSLVPIEGSIEKIKTGELSITKLTEYRDVVVKYNNDLATFRKLDKNWAIGALYPTPSDELKFITIK